MGFFKTLFTGYKIMFQDLNTKHNDLIPRCFSGCGTGLMMIGSAVMAKTAMKEDTQQVISEANAAIEEAKKSISGEKPVAQKARVFKARVRKGLKMIKVFRNGILMEVGGAVANGAGYFMAENGKHRALKAVGTLGAAFASYRAMVREDLGEEADIRYMSGKNALKKTGRVDKKTGEVTEELEYIQDDDGVTIKKDPNAFRFWFSRETCPSVWVDNYDLRVHKLRFIEDNLTLRLQSAGHISLNDMRREFGGLAPAEMDVGIGGIFGRVLKPDIPTMQQRVNLHFKDDENFMEGRTEGCWIIFDCDPEPIIGRIGKKFTQVER